MDSSGMLDKNRHQLFCSVFLYAYFNRFNGVRFDFDFNLTSSQYHIHRGVWIGIPQNKIFFLLSLKLLMARKRAILIKYGPKICGAWVPISSFEGHNFLISRKMRFASFLIQNNACCDFHEQIEIYFTLIDKYFSDLKMDQGTKRSLRARRPPGYLVNDSEDPDHLSYHAYNRTNYQKEYVSQAQELNATAKLLIKFVNSANRDLEEKMNNEDQIEKPNIPNEPQIPMKQSRKNQTVGSGVQQKPNSKRDQKDDESKPKAYLYSFKDKETSKRPPKVEENSLPARNTAKTENSIHSQYATLLSQISAQQKHLIQNDSAKNHLQAASRAIIQQQMLLNETPFFKDRAALQQPPARQTRDKLFGRSSFHVAIAYHIYLQKLRNSNAEAINEQNIDPTCHAKKLKHEQELKFFQEKIPN